MNTDVKILNNISKLNLAVYKKYHTPWSSGIYSRDAGMVDYLQSINVICHINQRKNESHTITSLDTEITFDKTPYPFMIKTLIKVGIEGTQLNKIKAIYDI